MEKINGRLLNWASILEDTTREQAERTASMPFIHPHLALMPDAHLGMGATVGSVIPTDGAIIPAAVGVDIGCGMIAVRTQFTADDVAGRDLDVLHNQIARSIPLSAGGRNTKIRASAEPRIAELRDMPGADQADAAVLGVIDPERGVVLVVPGASVDGVLHVVRGRVRPHVEGPGILREQGDERRAIISGRIRGREGDGHGGRVGEGGCRDAGESSHDTR